LLNALSTAILTPLIYTNCMSQPDFDSKVKSLISESVPLITASELKQKIKSTELIILDTRSKEEYDVSHIDGAIFVDYDDFEEGMVSGLDKNKEVVVYCSVGYRSEKVGEELQDLGFKNVNNLFGGIFGWKNNGNDVVCKTGVTDSVHTYNRSWSKWLIKGIKVY